MKTTRHVEVMRVTDPDGVDAYESLVNDPDIRVSDIQTYPLGDGSVLRAVDYRKPAPPSLRPLYAPPVC